MSRMCTIERLLGDGRLDDCGGEERVDDVSIEVIWSAPWSLMWSDMVSDIGSGSNSGDGDSSFSVCTTTEK